MTGKASELQLLFLGPPQVRLGNKLIGFPTRKALALLIYLALQARPQPREHLAALLWPESSPERSLASLRNTLGRLQSALSRASGRAQTSYITVTHTDLALNADAGIQLDLHTVEQAYAQARADRSSRTPPKGSTSLPLLQSAAASHRGDFLTGFSLGDAPGFDDWAAVQREVWRRRLGLILDRLSEIQFASGDYTSTAETASVWIALDALNEVAYRRKMRAHFAAGERGQALETYEACCAILIAELGLEPEPETDALAAQIRAQRPLLRPEPRPGRPDTPVAFLENLFAGRAEEHQALIQNYQLAAAGQPQVVVLLGEAGIGKTRLAAEFLGWAVSQDAEVLQGRAFESGSRMAYQPLIEAIRPVFTRENGLKDSLDEAWLAPLNQLLPEFDDRNSELPLAILESQPDRMHLFESLVQLTLAWSARAGPAPLVLFVDDLQWADSATLDWLPYAARRWRETGAQVMLVASLSSEAFQSPAQLGLPNLIDWLERMKRELEPSLVELGLLGERDTVHMMQSILSPAAADFAQWVFDETRGHPFYLVETLKDLLERRALHARRLAEGQWAFAVDAEHDLGQAVRVPSTVGAVVRSRLNRLSPNAFTLLAAGAVLEQRFTFERLCAVSHLPEDAGLPALDELIGGRLLREAPQAGAASAYTFAHNMLRDVVYTEAGDARRRLFHQRALEVLEAAHDPAAVLAHHALAAGLPEAVFRLSLVAGHEALRLAAPGEAIVHFEQARLLAQAAHLVDTELGSRLQEINLYLARAYELAGQPEQARAVLEPAAQPTQKSA